jgi:hypothetical protein
MNKTQRRNLIVKPSVDKTYFTFNSTPHDFIQKHFQVTDHPLDSFDYYNLPSKLLSYKKENIPLHIKNGYMKSYVDMRGSTGKKFEVIKKNHQFNGDLSLQFLPSIVSSHDLFFFYDLADLLNLKQQDFNLSSQEYSFDLHNISFKDVLNSVVGNYRYSSKNVFYCYQEDAEVKKVTSIQEMPKCVKYGLYVKSRKSSSQIKVYQKEEFGFEFIRVEVTLNREVFHQLGITTASDLYVNRSKVIDYVLERLSFGRFNRTLFQEDFPCSNDILNKTKDVPLMERLTILYKKYKSGFKGYYEFKNKYLIEHTDLNNQCRDLLTVYLDKMYFPRVDSLFERKLINQNRKRQEKVSGEQKVIDKYESLVDDAVEEAEKNNNIRPALALRQILLSEIETLYRRRKYVGTVNGLIKKLNIAETKNDIDKLYIDRVSWTEDVVSGLINKKDKRGLENLKAKLILETRQVVNGSPQCPAYQENRLEELMKLVDKGISTLNRDPSVTTGNSWIVRCAPHAHINKSEYKKYPYKLR